MTQHRIRTMVLPALLVSGTLVLASVQVGFASDATDAGTEPAAEMAPPSSSEPAQAAWSPDELNELVAPIALYPDALVAQIVAAASYPTQVADADQWVQQHSYLKGAELAQAADSQSWDPSVKALTQFPSVLDTMDKNLSWTSALGDAYVNQSQNVLDAVQEMRRRAQQAGNLESTPQESVTTEGQSIAIQPAEPDVVYVPEYDPWDVYGEPLAIYPGWDFDADGLLGPGIAFGVGIGIGAYGGFGWGWHHWGADWHGREVVYNHNAYHHDGHFGDHDHFDLGHGGVGRPAFAHDHPDFGHPGGFAGRVPDGASRMALAGHSGAFNGANHGGAANTYGSRGPAGLSGAPRGPAGSGGGFHGSGGGGFHGGGGGHR
jgi:uncharacterized membrane protein YgcG